MLGEEQRTNVRESWKNNVAGVPAVPGSTSNSVFMQEEMYRIPSGTEMRTSAGTVVDVRNGVCREFTRMWIFARNSPESCKSLPRSEYATRQKWNEPPELSLLRKHMVTLMVGQAQAEARQVSWVPKVSGLVITEWHQKAGVKDFVHKYLWKKGGALFYVSVHVSGGTHAIGFDTRNGEFHMFDSEYGMLSCPSATLLHGGIDRFIQDYYRIAKYRGNYVMRYGRCVV